MSTKHILSDVRVVIVGAGLAGLSAAEELVKSGFKQVVVLEATHRIGGRVHSVNFGSDKQCNVELGAHYIAGTSNTCSSWVLATQCGLAHGSTSDNRPNSTERRGRVCTSDGRVLDEAFSFSAFDLFTEWFDDIPDKIVSVREYLLEKFDKEKHDHFDESDFDDARKMLHIALDYTSLDQGGPTSTIRMPVGCGYEYVDGGLQQVPGRMDELVKSICQSIPKAQIKLNTEVTDVNWGNDVKVTCQGQDGEEIYEADHVIITSSLGFLKHRAKEMFHPRIPVEKMEAIDSIEFGKNGKLYVEFEQPLWNNEKGQMTIAWTEEDKKTYSDHWMTSVSTIEPHKKFPNIFLFWTRDEGAIKLEELPEETIKNDVAFLLRKVLNNPSIPPPKKCLSSTWNSNPFQRGVYSYMGLKSRPEHMDHLASPVLHRGCPRLLFAGEATISSGHGYMHGARDSGIREAERLTTMYSWQGKVSYEFSICYSNLSTVISHI